MTSIADAPALLREATVTPLRPRYEGANICTWIGFKHVNYLVEEAVLAHLRDGGWPAGRLYERYGIGTELVTVDTRIATALHVDDLVEAEVRPTGVADDELGFRVLIRVSGRDRPAATATVRVVFRRDDGTGDIPDELAPYAVARLGRTAPAPTSGASVDPDRLLAGPAAGHNAHAWRWRIPYYYCHFTQRLQMSGYLRLMEEAVDRLLAERGVSIKRLLDEQRWIPVVPHSTVTLVGEALMEEELVTVFTVEEVFKDLTYTARMDCYALREGRAVPTATGRITHGYAHIDNRRDWHLVTFDDRLSRALRGAGR
jgi:acyl-CoA thioesterase FadM